MGTKLIRVGLGLAFLALNALACSQQGGSSTHALDESAQNGEEQTEATQTEEAQPGGGLPGCPEVYPAEPCDRAPSAELLDEAFCSGVTKVDNKYGQDRPTRVVVVPSAYPDCPGLSLHVDLGTRVEDGESFSDGGIGLGIQIEGMPRDQPLKVSEHPGLVDGLHYWNASSTVNPDGSGVGVGGSWGQPVVFDGTVAIGAGDKPTITFCIQANYCGSDLSTIIYGQVTDESYGSN